MGTLEVVQPVAFRCAWRGGLPEWLLRAGREKAFTVETPTVQLEQWGDVINLGVRT